MTFGLSPRNAFATLSQNRELVLELIKRDFMGRYKGSVVGVGWSLFNPLLMLGIYTFVFSVALKVRWGVEIGGNVSFATVLFSGMIVHGLFAECVIRAPTLVSSTPNYVKKVIFPIEVLPWVVMASALLHFAVSFFVLLLFCVILGNGFGIGALLVPILLLPLVLLTVGVTWALASLGVYLRDLSQGMGIVVTVFLFVSPVFYSVESVPPEYRLIIAMNPLTLPIEQLRDAVLWSRPIEWKDWLASLLVGMGVFYSGFVWFQRTRKGFSDVL